MSEMIERVAIALYEHEWNAPPIEGFRGMTAGDKIYWSAAARRAIAAMRDPTDEMLIAAHDCNHEHGGLPTYQWLYEAMVDAALDRKVTEPTPALGGPDA